jgi:hypothetical protein
MTHHHLKLLVAV